MLQRLIKFASLGPVMPTVRSLLIAFVMAGVPASLLAQAGEVEAHGGIGLTVLSSRGPDSFTDEQVSARGWGGIAWAPISPLFHGYATLEGFTNASGHTPATFGSFSTVFTVPIRGVPYGFVPFVGAGLALGGGAPGVTPVLSGGTLWSISKKGGLVPFAMVERHTRRDRTSLRLGVWYGI